MAAGYCSRECFQCRAAEDALKGKVAELTSRLGRASQLAADLQVSS